MDASERHTVATPTDVTPLGPPAEPLTAPIPGLPFGGYSIVRAVGKGGMGHVYEAFDAELNRTVAVKTMLPELAASAATRERFVEEARALAAVSNDHVVTVHDVGVCDGLPFLVMEYLTGETLDARLNRASIPLVQILKIGCEVASGLAAAHQAGIVHRDVKPDNLFLEARNDRAVLIDFGLAYTTQAGPSQSAVRAGTPQYMSPEQVRGEPVDPRTDLFSLGVVLYRLCGGRMPFAGKSIALWRTQLLSDDTPTPVEMLNPKVPPPLADLIRRLLAKDRDHRPASAAAVEWELMQLFQSVLSFTHSGVVSHTGRLPAPSERTVVDLEEVAPSVPTRERKWGILVAAMVLIGFVVAVTPWLRLPQPVASVSSGSPVVTPATASQSNTIPTSEQPKPKPISLFDGRTIAGWHGVEQQTGRWAVKDGALIGTPKGNDDQYLLSDREFTDFDLRFEFRWTGKGGHTTLLFRAKDGGPLTEKDKKAGKSRVTGLELNLGDDEHYPEVHKRPIGPLYESGGVYFIKPPKPAAPNKPIGEWNTVRVVSDRQRLRVEWNGVVTFDEDLDRFAHKAADVPALARSKGSIGLRTHGARPIEYRNLTVTPIER